MVMSDFKQVLALSSLFGAVSAGALGTLHYVLKPLKLKPVANYAIGSSACLTAASAFLLWFRVKKVLIVGIWFIWFLAGLVVAGLHLIDRKRRERRNLKINGDPHFPDN